MSNRKSCSNLSKIAVMSLTSISWLVSSFPPSGLDTRGGGNASLSGCPQLHNYVHEDGAIGHDPNSLIVFFICGTVVDYTSMTFASCEGLSVYISRINQAFYLFNSNTHYFLQHNNSGRQWLVKMRHLASLVSF